ncbi:MAG: serine/threonine protein kinase [Bacteroidetes bacterium]|nr:serine/threonine protein kinase [Bacteroidota bacterium]
MDSNIFTICPGCGIKLPNKKLPYHERYNASGECAALYDQLSYFTISQHDVFFIHQLAVDSYGAQHSGGVTKDITTFYALIGLCLAVEHNFTGRQVQMVHMKIPKQKWEKLSPMKQNFSITVATVLEADIGEARNILIKKWANSVWESWSEYHEFIRQRTKEYSKNFTRFL